jgi:hypothetical protein
MTGALMILEDLASPTAAAAPLEVFLDQIPTESTRRGYLSHLRSFIDAIYGPQHAGRTCNHDEAARRIHRGGD